MQSQVAIKKAMENVAIQYFTRWFSASLIVYVQYFIWRKALTEASRNWMTRAISNKEIHSHVWSWFCLSPRPSGLHCQKLSMFLEHHRGRGRLLKELNYTFIALILKTPHADNFWPISLYDFVCSYFQDYCQQVEAYYASLSAIRQHLSQEDTLARVSFLAISWSQKFKVIMEMLDCV